MEVNHKLSKRSMFNMLKIGMNASDLVDRIGKGDTYEMGQDWMNVTYKNQDGSSIIVGYKWHQTGQNGYYVVNELQVIGTLRD